MLTRILIKTILFSICSFLYLHKETNQRKCSRSLAVSLLAFGFPVLLIKCRRLGKSRSLCPVFRGTPPSRSAALYSAARLREMATKPLPVLFLGPHSFALSITAVGGIRCKNCLRRSRVFLHPANSEKRKVPTAGGRERRVPFSCFFFWARKRRRIYNKGSYLRLSLTCG